MAQVDLSHEPPQPLSRVTWAGKLDKNRNRSAPPPRRSKSNVNEVTDGAEPKQVDPLNCGATQPAPPRDNDVVNLVATVVDTNVVDLVGDDDNGPPLPPPQTGLPTNQQVQPLSHQTELLNVDACSHSSFSAVQPAHGANLRAKSIPPPRPRLWPYS